MPDLEYEKTRMEDWALRTLFSKTFSGNVYKRGLEVPKGFTGSFAENCGLDSPYGNALIPYMNQWLKNMDEIWKIVMKHPKFKEPVDGTIRAFRSQGSEMQCNFHNIMNCLKPKEWFPVASFCRPVDPEHFKNYKLSPATMMEGFHGNYWKLSNVDEEKDSYERLGQMTKMFGKDNLQILGAE